MTLSRKLLTLTATALAVAVGVQQWQMRTSYDRQVRQLAHSVERKGCVGLWPYVIEIEKESYGLTPGTFERVCQLIEQNFGNRLGEYGVSIDASPSLTYVNTEVGRTRLDEPTTLGIVVERTSRGPRVLLSTIIGRSWIVRYADASQENPYSWEQSLAALEEQGPRLAQYGITGFYGSDGTFHSFESALNHHKKEMGRP